MRRSILAAGLLWILAALAGCGQKGPLVRPGSSPAPAHSAPAAPASDLPTPVPGESGV